MSMMRERLNSIGSVNPDLRIIGTNLGPTETPLVRIQIYPGLISYEDLQPLIAPDGAPIAATGPGTWGQLYAAGRRSGR